VEDLQPVERDASSMPSRVDGAYSAPYNAAGTRTVYNDTGMYSRPLTSSGGRNMQDSSFSLSGMSDSSVLHVICLYLHDHSSTDTCVHTEKPHQVLLCNTTLKTHP